MTIFKRFPCGCYLDENLRLYRCPSCNTLDAPCLVCPEKDARIAALEAEVEKLRHAIEVMGDALVVGGSKRKDEALDIGREALKAAQGRGEE